jgi:hypothetical protein
MVDPRARPPEEILAHAEVVELVEKELRPEHPRPGVPMRWPRYLLGTSGPWPIAWTVGNPCPVCGHQLRLPPGCACLVCDRAGAEPPRVLVARAGRRRPALVGGLGRASG